MRAYAGRQHIEVNFDEVKELGLGHYQGRSGTGVRRWAVLLCLAQALLKLAATGHLKLALPTLNWSWYKREDSVGQIRRRLIEHCRPRISRPLPPPAKSAEAVVTEGFQGFFNAVSRQLELKNNGTVQPLLVALATADISCGFSTYGTMVSEFPCRVSDA